MKITLQIDGEVKGEFYSMDMFIKFYGYICSTLNISSITYDENVIFEGFSCVKITTLQNALKILDLEMEYE